MDLEIIILGEVGQRKINIIWYHLYIGSNKIIQKNLFTKWKKNSYFFSLVNHYFILFYFIFIFPLYSKGVRLSLDVYIAITFFPHHGFLFGNYRFDLKIYEFLWLSSIPLCTYTTSSESNPLSMDIWVVSMSWLLWIVLQWTCGCMCLF